MPQQVFKGNILLLISGKVITFLKFWKHRIINYLQNSYAQPVSKKNNYTFSKQVEVIIIINEEGLSN